MSHIRKVESGINRKGTVNTKKSVQHLPTNSTLIIASMVFAIIVLVSSMLLLSYTLLFSNDGVSNAQFSLDESNRLMSFCPQSGDLVDVYVDGGQVITFFYSDNEIHAYYNCNGSSLPFASFPVPNGLAQDNYAGMNRRNDRFYPVWVYQSELYTSGLLR